MKLAPLLLLSLICLSCGGALKGKIAGRTPASVIERPANEVLDQRLFLSVLERKYESEQKPINLAIVRSMILELEEKYPGLYRATAPGTVESLRKDPTFLSLELTIEHLSHREAVKLSTRHSAFITILDP